LLTKADYPAEMDIQLPFSMISNNASKDRLEIFPAFWWLYNMYALARNASKYQQRDKRIHKVQKIEFEAFAPDTAEEMILGLRLLEIWTAKASLRKQGISVFEKTDEELAELGQILLTGNPDEIDSLEILGENVEKGKRKAVIFKVYKGWHAYRDMLFNYAMKNLIDYFATHPEATIATMHDDLKGKRQQNWVNLGGQLIKRDDLDKLRSDIGNGKLSSWKEIHDRYDKLWEVYPRDKQRHAYSVLCELLNTEHLTPEQWISSLDKAEEIKKFITEQVYISREKDYENHFRQITFENHEEMIAAIGEIKDNSFIIQMKQEYDEFKVKVTELKKIS
jgi:hypothetical protein